MQILILSTLNNACCDLIRKDHPAAAQFDLRGHETAVWVRVGGGERAVGGRWNAPPGTCASVSNAAQRTISELAPKIAIDAASLESESEMRYRSLAVIFAVAARRLYGIARANANRLVYCSPLLLTSFRRGTLKSS